MTRAANFDFLSIDLVGGNNFAHQFEMDFVLEIGDNMMRPLSRTIVVRINIHVMAAFGLFPGL
jgi:hypothetical protein